MLEKVRLGKTGLMVTRVSMGCIPIQRLSMDEAEKLLLHALDLGVNFFDSAHTYTDSEEKIGRAFTGQMREKIILASKTKSDDYETTIKQIDESLRRFKTDYIDIYQWHNPENMNDFLNAHGPYQALEAARRAGKIRYIGLTNHNLTRTRKAIETDAFDTVQYPLSLLSTAEEIEMTYLARDRDIGVIAMKGMCGGHLDDGRLPFAFLNQYPHIVPIWGVEKIAELEQFINLAACPEPFSEEMRAETEKLRQLHGDEFCRGCGYCLPCPADIPLPMLTRIVLLIKRSVPQAQFTPERLAEIERIDHCQNCGHCIAHCPYHLDVPKILQEQKTAYLELYKKYSKKTETQASVVQKL